MGAWIAALPAAANSGDVYASLEPGRLKPGRLDPGRLTG
jgi:hypothetical protein